MPNQAVVYKCSVQTAKITSKHSCLLRIVDLDFELKNDSV